MAFSVALITGSGGNGLLTEIYNPDTKVGCFLPELPESRWLHTQDGDLTCGGGRTSTQNTCVKWSPSFGNWTQSHTLRQRRYNHVSWATASGVYLMGGDFSKRTSEMVKFDGSVEDGFSLKYDTW